MPFTVKVTPGRSFSMAPMNVCRVSMRSRACATAAAAMVDSENPRRNPSSATVGSSTGQRARPSSTHTVSPSRRAPMPRTAVSAAMRAARTSWRSMVTSTVPGRARRFASERSHCHEGSAVMRGERP